MLSESRAAGQALVYRRNEQLQTGPAVAQDQEGMELEEGGHDEHQVGVLGVGVQGNCWGWGQAHAAAAHTAVTELQSGTARQDRGPSSRNRGAP